MADFRSDDRYRGGLKGVTLLVVDRYAARAHRDPESGELHHNVDVQVLATEGANTHLRPQTQPALNVRDGEPVRLGYPDAVMAKVSVMAAKGPGGSAQRVFDSAGRVRGAAYVVRADLAMVPGPQGVYGEGARRFDVRIDPLTIEPAPINLLIPRGVERAQTECVERNRAAAEQVRAGERSPAPQVEHGGL